MAVSRADIIAAIRREAAAQGKAPGKVRFSQATGIQEKDWIGRYWGRWSDALREAGFEPNAWQTTEVDDEGLVRHLASLAVRLGHYPVSAERKLHRRDNPSFPSANTFDTRLGNRRRQLELLRDFALANPEYSAVYEMVAPLITDRVSEPALPNSGTTSGSVYLMRSGDYYKVGRSNHVGRRAYEIALQLPEKLEVEHVIETDDPEGIEYYWHRRFAAKRRNGEWFLLDRMDVDAFRRRKRM